MNPIVLPVVTMLWEVGDPHAALGSRFGFTEPLDAAVWLQTLMANYYGLTVTRCERITLSATNALAWVETPSGKYVVKWCCNSQRFPHLAALADLTVWLADRGRPVSTPLAALDGQRQIVVDGVSVGVQQHIQAELLDVNSADAVYAAGVEYGHLHVILAAHPHVEIAGDTPSRPLIERIDSLTHALAGRVPEQVLALLGHDAAAAHLSTTDSSAAGSTLADAQLVHGDFRSANILCDGAEVVAVLDFEETHRAYRVCDAAKSAVLLGTRYHDWAPSPTCVHRTFRAGIESVAPFSEHEAAWWDVLIQANTLQLFSNMHPPRDN